MFTVRTLCMQHYTDFCIMICEKPVSLENRYDFTVMCCNAFKTKV